MKSIPVIRVAVRRGLNTTDDGGGTEFQVDTAGMGALPRVRGVIGEGVTGGAPPNP